MPGTKEPTVYDPATTCIVNAPVVSVEARVPNPPCGSYAYTSAFAITLFAPSFTNPRICLPAVVKVNTNVPSFAGPAEILISSGFGITYVGIGGGPDIGPFGIWGPTPTYHVPLARLRVKFSANGTWYVGV